MIVDLHELGDGANLESDLCIIGAGAAGIAMAREFLGTRHSVLLLEGGGLESEAQSQALYESEVVGYPHSGIHSGRARVFGGTTTLWAGQALPLDELDFRPRPWVADSGWPFSRMELEPYYRRAEGVMGLGRLDYGLSRWPPLPQLASDGSKFRTATSQFSPQPNFAIAYGAQLKQADNVKAVFHANALRIHAHRNGSRVEMVEIGSLAGQRGFVRAKHFVVCCGAIETARLLLVSDNVHRNGLGNEFDLVGRYFQDHVQATGLPLIRGCGRELRMLPVAHYFGGIAQSPKLCLSETLQESECLLNAAVGVTYDEFPSLDSPVEAAKRLVKAVLNGQPGTARWVDLRRAVMAPHQVATAGYRRYVKKEAAFRMGGAPHVGIQCECAPIPSSRVTLSSQTDPLGVRRARLDWQLSPLVLKTVLAAARSFGEEIERLGLGECDLESLEAKTMEQLGFFDCNHHIGTARMSDGPRTGVVNPDCRMHALENLYVGSSAVFPTGGYSNPTLTILALVMRLSDHLKSRLAAES
jgi:choline dehydrogenase-like flavoprotein